jgi:hypothetical protein
VDSRRESLWRLVFERAECKGRSGWTGIVCDIVPENVAVDGAAIVARIDRIADQELVAATGDWARHIEEFQYTVGVGPATEAYETSQPVLAPDIAALQHRWPGFADLAAREGLGAAFAFPLRTMTAPIGTVNLYRRRRGVLSPDHLTEAEAIADVAATAVLADAVDSDAPAPWARVETPGHYDIVHTATGLLAAELKITVQEAFLRLRAKAFDRGRGVLDIARDVLRRELPADAFRD